MPTAAPPQDFVDELPTIIRDVESLADSFRDNYFKGVVDFLKFTTTFIIAFLVWIFANFQEYSVNFVFLIAFSAVLSSLFSLGMIYSILNFYNKGLKMRRLHQESLAHYIPNVVTTSMVTRQNQAIQSIQSLKKQEKQLSNDLPVYVFLHVAFIIISLTLVAIMKIGVTLSGVMLFCLFIAGILIFSFIGIQRSE